MVQKTLIGRETRGADIETRLGGVMIRIGGAEFAVFQYLGIKLDHIDIMVMDGGVFPVLFLCFGGKNSSAVIMLPPAKSITGRG